VDDALFFGPNKAFVEKLKTKFMARWDCRDLGAAEVFLGMRICCHGKRICIDQCDYLKKLLEHCGMQDARPAATPLLAGYMPVPNTGPLNPELRARFQMVIGLLLYLMLGTRPDIDFAMTKLSQYSTNPTKDHYNAALHVCRYLAGTRGCCLVYDGDSQAGLIAYADSDWDTNPHLRHLQSGSFLKLANGVITWSLHAQKTVALLSTEAKYMSISDCSRQCAWIHSLFSKIGYPMKAPIPLCGDNQGSIFLASNPATGKLSKHIDIRFHYIRQEVQHKHIDVLFVDGIENPADMFTKNLARVKFEKFRGQLGLEFKK
jgi:hypothetical protein